MSQPPESTRDEARAIAYLRDFDQIDTEPDGLMVTRLVKSFAAVRAEAFDEADRALRNAEMPGLPEGQAIGLSLAREVLANLAGRHALELPAATRPKVDEPSPPPERATCPTCHGSGHVDVDELAPLPNTETCPDCNGTGTSNPEPAGKKGTGDG